MSTVKITKRRTCNPEQKKKNIAYVARKLFVEKGYYAVTIPDIVLESGTSTGSVYKYFGSKSKLAQQLFEDSSLEFNQLLSERLQGQTGTFERAESIAELLLDLAKVNSTLIEYLFFLRHQEFVLKYCPVIGYPPNCLLCQIFEDGIRVGELRPGDPLSKAVAFLGVVLKHVEMQLKGLYHQPLPLEYAGNIMQQAWNAAY